MRNINNYIFEHTGSWLLQPTMEWPEQKDDSEKVQLDFYDIWNLPENEYPRVPMKDIDNKSMNISDDTKQKAIEFFNKNVKNNKTLFQSDAFHTGNSLFLIDILYEDAQDYFTNKWGMRAPMRRLYDKLSVTAQEHEEGNVEEFLNIMWRAFCHEWAKEEFRGTSVHHPSGYIYKK